MMCGIPSSLKASSATWPTYPKSVFVSRSALRACLSLWTQPYWIFCTAYSYYVVPFNGHWNIPVLNNDSLYLVSLILYFCHLLRSMLFLFAWTRVFFLLWTLVRKCMVTRKREEKTSVRSVTNQLFRELGKGLLCITWPLTKFTLNRNIFYL